MASIKYVRTDKDEYWLIQISQGRGKSPVSQRWRPPPNTRWSQATKEKKAQAYAADLEKQVKAGTFKTKKQLKEEQEQQEAELANRPTVERYYREIYIPMKQRSVADNTIANYDLLFMHWVFPVIGNNVLIVITHKEVQGIINSIFDSLKRVTAILYSQMLHNFFAFAYKTEAIKADVWLKIYIPPEKKDDQAYRMQKKDEKSLSISETKQVIQYAKNENPFWRAAIELLVDTGMRCGELCGLQWQDVDADSLHINIVRAIRFNRKKKCYETVPPKTLSSIRSIDIGPETMLALEMLQNAQRESGYYVDGSTWIFPGKNLVDPIRLRSVECHISRFAVKYNLRHLFPHQFRHAAVSRSLDGGASLAGTAKRMGHSSQSTTLGVYNHAMEGASESAGDAARRLLQEDYEDPET